MFYPARPPAHWPMLAEVGVPDLLLAVLGDVSDRRMAANREPLLPSHPPPARPPGPRDRRGGAVSINNVLTIPADLLGRTLGFLTPGEERHRARAIVLAYDLEVPLLEEP